MNMENGWTAGKAEGDANRGMIMRWSNLGQEGLFMVWTSTLVTSRVTTPPQASVEGMDCGSVTNPVSGDWEELLPVSELGSDRQHLFSIKNRRPLTHVRLNIFPDGGIARLRVYETQSGLVGY